VYLFVHLGLPRHLRRLLDHLQTQHPTHAAELRAALSTETLRDPLSVGSVREGLRLRAALAGLWRAQDGLVWEEELAAAGLCGVVCRTAGAWSEHPQARADGQLVELGGALVPGGVAHVRGVPALRAAVEVDGVTWEPTTPDPTAPLAPPLAGVKVLDLTRVIAGPVAGRTLAALGAQVTKVVDPRETQGWVEAFRAIFDPGKRMMPLDLSTRTGRAALRAHLESDPPDVVLHNFRPAAADRLGLLEHELRTVVPDVVLTVVSAYGPRGPWSGRPGWEQTAQALVGTQLEYGGGPVPELVPLPATDLATGLFAALGTVAALRGRARGDSAPRVDVSLTGAQIQLRDGAPSPVPLGAAPGLAARLAQVPDLVVRSERAGLGAVTELALPWRMEGAARTLPGPGAVEGAPGARSRLRVWGSTARWATLLAASRLRR
jgi:crotonobetainyl-CoA:carnitine CoA-transferase CaiB-like acyl-CoA transferase